MESTRSVSCVLGQLVDLTDVETRVRDRSYKTQPSAHTPVNYAPNTKDEPRL